MMNKTVWEVWEMLNGWFAVRRTAVRCIEILEHQSLQSNAL